MSDINLQNITIPLSYFYIKDTAGSKTVQLDSEGVASGWTSLGATIGEGRFEYSRQLGSLELEGYSSPISGGTYYENESATITVPLAELTYNNVLSITQSSQGPYFGGETTTHETQVLCVTEHRAGSGDFHYFQLFQAVLESSLSLSFSKSSPTVYEVTFRGLLDITQPQGKQLGRIDIATIRS